VVPLETSSARNRPERRQHPRKKVEIKAELHAEGNVRPFRTKATDLTLGGCFAEMIFTMDIGTKLNIDLWLDDIKVSATGVVVTRLHNRGNGIKFTNLGADNRARVKQFLAVAQDTQSAM
jgi:PilZ domain